MENLLQLHLNDDPEKTEAPNPAPAVNQEQMSAEEDERLKRIAAKAAHKASTEYRQSRSSLFSK